MMNDVGDAGEQALGLCRWIHPVLTTTPQSGWHCHVFYPVEGWGGLGGNTPVIHSSDPNNAIRWGPGVLWTHQPLEDATLIPVSQPHAKLLLLQMPLTWLYFS